MRKTQDIMELRQYKDQSVTVIYATGKSIGEETVHTEEMSWGTEHTVERPHKQGIRTRAIKGVLKDVSLSYIVLDPASIELVRHRDRRRDSGTPPYNEEGKVDLEWHIRYIDVDRENLRWENPSFNRYSYFFHVHRRE